MIFTHGSLFAGIGGFDLGFERAGFKTLWQVECDPYALKVLEKHWPDVQRYTDVRTFLDERPTPPCIISGGFPCQDISSAGLRKGIEKGERSSLWKYAVKAISILRPKYFIVENVSALLFRGMDRVLGDLSEIRYDAEWEVISAHTFLAPHLRQRTFIVAYPSSDRARRTQGIFESYRNMGRYQQLDSLFDWGGVSVDWSSKKTICQSVGTPKLCRMDDGIPDVPYRLKCLGNAVVPQIAEWIAWQIRHVIEAEAKVG